MSAALTRVFLDGMSCSEDRSPEVSVQCIKQLSLIPTQRHLLAGQFNSSLKDLLDLFP